MGKLNCVYLEKTEFDHETLSKNITGSDIVTICGELQITRVMGHQYASTKDLYKKTKVPVDFINKALEIIEKRKNDRQLAIQNTEKSIKSLNN